MDDLLSGIEDLVEPAAPPQGGGAFNPTERAKQLAAKYKIPEDLVLKVMHQESGGKQYGGGGVLTSPKGAKGFMQVLPATGRALGFDVNDPEQNLEAGVAYLAKSYTRWSGNPALALAGYHSGIEDAQAAMSNPRGNPKTHAYVKAILGNQAYAKALGRRGAAASQAPDLSAGIEHLIESGNAAKNGDTIPAANAQPQNGDLLSGIEHLVEPGGQAQESGGNIPKNIPAPTIAPSAVTEGNLSDIIAPGAPAAPTASAFPVEMTPGVVQPPADATAMPQNAQPGIYDVLSEALGLAPNQQSAQPPATEMVGAEEQPPVESRAGQFPIPASAGQPPTPEYALPGTAMKPGRDLATLKRNLDNKAANLQRLALVAKEGGDPQRQEFERAAMDYRQTVDTYNQTARRVQTRQMAATQRDGMARGDEIVPSVKPGFVMFKYAETLEGKPLYRQVRARSKEELDRFVRQYRPLLPNENIQDEAQLDQRLGELARMRGQLLGQPPEQAGPSLQAVEAKLLQLSQVKNDLLRMQAGGEQSPQTPSSGQRQRLTDAERKALPWNQKGVMADLAYGIFSVPQMVERLTLGTERATGIAPTPGFAEHLDEFDRNVMGDLAERGTQGLPGDVSRAVTSTIAKLPAFGGVARLGGALGASGETAAFGAMGGLEAAGQPQIPDLKDIGKSAVLSAAMIPIYKAAGLIPNRAARILAAGAGGAAVPAIGGQQAGDIVSSAIISAAFAYPGGGRGLFDLDPNKPPKQVQPLLEDLADYLVKNHGFRDTDAADYVSRLWAVTAEESANQGLNPRNIRQKTQEFIGRYEDQYGGPLQARARSEGKALGGTERPARDLGEAGTETGPRSLGKAEPGATPIEEIEPGAPPQRTLGRAAPDVTPIEEVPGQPARFGGTGKAAGESGARSIALIDATGKVINREVGEPAESDAPSIDAIARKFGGRVDESNLNQELLDDVAADAKRRGLQKETGNLPPSERDAATGTLKSRLQNVYQAVAKRLGVKQPLPDKSFDEAAASLMPVVSEQKRQKKPEAQAAAKSPASVLKGEPSPAPITTTKGETYAIEEGKQQGNDEGKLSGVRSGTNLPENRSEVRQAEGRQAARSSSAERGGQEQFAAKPETALAPRELQPGDEVSHPAFAKGAPLTVKSVEGDTINLEMQRADGTIKSLSVRADSKIGRELQFVNPPAAKPIEEPAHAQSAVPTKEGAIVSEEPARVQGVEGIVKRVKEERRQIEEKAATDTLTGLQNQNQWEGAKSRIEAAPETHIARLDVNDLKRVNDSFGHEAGDAYIKQAGQIIGEEATKAGVTPRMQFRTGGDEFTLAGPKPAVTAAARAIQARIASEVKLPDDAYGSVAFGVAPKEKAADALMYVNKKAMKAAVVSETPKAAEIAKKPSGPIVEKPAESGPPVKRPSRADAIRLAEEAAARKVQKQAVTQAKAQEKIATARGISKPAEAPGIEAKGTGKLQAVADKSASSETPKPATQTKPPAIAKLQDRLQSLNDDDLWSEGGQASLTPAGWQIAETAMRPVASERATFKPHEEADYIELNAAGKQALTRAYGKPATGLTVNRPQARKIAEDARQIAAETKNGAERQNLLDLAEAVEAFSAGRAEFAIGRPRTFQHESQHVADLAIQRFFGYAFSAAEAERLAQYEPFKRALIDKGYPAEAQPQRFAMEAIAHVVNQQWDELGLTARQAIAFAKSYYEMIARVYKPDALKRYRELTGHFKELRDVVKENSEAQIQAAANRALGRGAGAVSEGRQEGAGEVSAPSEGQAALENLKRQTETPEFKRWFGRSVITENGEPGGSPLVVYHGTGSTNIERFLPHGFGAEKINEVLNLFRSAKERNERFGYMNFRGGTFFSPHPSYAGGYTGENTGVMYPVYIKAENPVYMDQKTGEVTGIDPNKTPDALVMHEEGLINEVAVIDPTQVKSAIGNRGTFDPNSPDILADLSAIPLPPRVTQALVEITHAFIESGETDFDVLMNEIEAAVSADRFSRISPHLSEIISAVYDKLEGPTAPAEPTPHSEGKRQAAIARLKERRVEPPRTIKPAKPRDVSVKPTDSLLAAIQKIGIDPRTPEGGDLARYLGAKEGGRPGMLNKSRLPGGEARGIDNLLTRLGEEGWQFEDKNDLFEAIRKELAGHKVYSSAHDFDADFERAFDGEFGAEAKTSSVVGSLRELLDHPETRALIDRFAQGEYTDEDADLFGQIARYELNVPEEIITAALEDARASAAALRADRLGREDVPQDAIAGEQSTISGNERATGRQENPVTLPARTPEEEAYLKTYGHDLSVVTEAHAAGLTTDQFDRVRALHESLQQQGQPVDEYLRQEGLFGEELNPAQQRLLRQLATKERRARSADEQAGLFADLAPRLSDEDKRDLAIIAGFHIDEGVRNFADFGNRMLADVGDWVKPHLRDLYDEATRDVGITPVAEEIPRPAPASQAPKMTGVKNAETADERQARGLSPVEKQAYTNMGQALLDGKQAVESGAIDPRALAAEIARKPSALTATEVGALGFHRTQLMNEHTEAMATVAKAIDDQDAALEINQRARVSRIEADFALNDEALQKGGREQSAAFNARKMMIAEDYSLVAVVNRMTAGKGEPLTSEERMRLEKLVAVENQAAQDLQKRLDKAEAEIRRLKATRAVKEMHPAGKARPQEKLDAEVKSLIGQLAKLSATSAPQPMADLEAPFADLASPEEALTPDHPEVARIVKALARNRVEAGLDTAEAITDAVYDLVKEHVPDITKRQVADLWAGSARPSQRTKGELALRLAEVRRQQKLLNDIEDAERGSAPQAGKAPSRQQSQRVEALRQQLDGILRQQGLKIDRTQSPEARLKAAKTRLTKELAQLRADIKAKNYSRKKVRTEIPYDKEATDLRAARDTARDEIEQMRLKAERANRSNGQKWLDGAVSWRRAILLSSVMIGLKLQSMVVARAVTTVAEEVFGAMLHITPGIRRFSLKAPRHGGGLNMHAEASALLALFGKSRYGPEPKTYAAVKSKLLTGKSKLDVVYGGKKYNLDPEAMAFFAHAHGALKEPARIAEFNRSYVKRMATEKRRMIISGATPEEADYHCMQPETQIGVGMGAYLDANRAISMQDNATNESINRLLADWERRGVGGRVAAGAFRIEFPIVKVGTNLAFEGSSYVAGGLKGIIKIMRLKAAAGGSGKGGKGGGGGDKSTSWIDDISPEDADYIMRAFKKQGAGGFFMALAVLSALGLISFIQFGGYYRGKKKKEGEPEPGTVVLAGYRLPRWLAHHPILEAGQFGATAMQIYKEVREKGDSLLSAVSSGAWGATKGLAEEVPYIGQVVRRARESEREGFLEKAGGALAEDLVIPLDVERYVKATDPAEAGGAGAAAMRFFDLKQPEFKRKPEGVKETFEAAIPGLRSNVPLVRGLPEDVGKELQAADKTFGKPKRKEDESLKDYTARVERENAAIAPDVRTLVGMDEYKNATQEKRKKMLKETISHARAQAEAKTAESASEHELWQERQLIHGRIAEAVKVRADFKALDEDSREAVLRAVGALLNDFGLTKDERTKMDTASREKRANDLLEELRDFDQKIQNPDKLNDEIERAIERARRRAA